MSPMEIIKRNTLGEVKFRYPGRVVEQFENGVIIEAFFNRDDLPFHGITLRRGDRFLETYYTNKWYNIYEIHDNDDDRVKGWYCNISFPAEIHADRIEFTDLALDLLAFPDGRYLVLDEDEFSMINLPEEIKANALIGLSQLRSIFSGKKKINLGRILST
jgi:hypothetical protein